MPPRRPAPRTILVTGGAGFIGSHVCTALLDQGHAVRCFDNFATGKRENIAHLDGNKSFTVVTGDIMHGVDVAKAVQGVDTIVHLAALGSVPRSIADPLASEAANLTGFLNVLEACRTQGVERLVYASSSSVYGDSTASPKREGLEGTPLSPYAVTKVMDEAYAGLYQRLFGVRTIGLRFFNVFGERQDPEGPYAAAIPRFIKSLLQHQRPTVFGDGEQTRDFTYVGNAVHAVEVALACSDPRAIGEVFNIAVGASTSLNDLLSMICQRLAVMDPQAAGQEAEHHGERPGDVRNSLADITKARELLGFEPAIDVAAGLDRAVPWYAAHWG
jgi:UDP-N-acetylglucosamine/UDP-N-acetylgalactosamine 4-epimerase